MRRMYRGLYFRLVALSLLIGLSGVLGGVPAGGAPNLACSDDEFGNECMKRYNDCVRMYGSEHKACKDMLADCGLTQQ